MILQTCIYPHREWADAFFIIEMRIYFFLKENWPKSVPASKRAKNETRPVLPLNPTKSQNKVKYDFFNLIICDCF